MRSYTPLRYPGGKAKLYNRIKDIIDLNNLNQCTYVEPFAGGFGIGMRLLLDNIVPQVILNDLDNHIFNLWYSVIHETDELCETIQRTDITLQERSRQLAIYNDINSSVLQDGFATLFLNRVNFSGIIKGGPIGGQRQESKYKIDCRFNKQAIIESIRRIGEQRERIEIYNEDASELITHIIPKQNIFLNIDPPYVVKGAVLYANYFNSNNHIELSKTILRELNNVPWVMTYDDVPLIRNLYNNLHLIEYSLQHSAGSSHSGRELAILNNIQYNWD